MSGDDIKANCDDGSLSGNRLLFNANRAKSVIIFNWDVEADNTAILKVERMDRALQELSAEIADAEDLLNPIQTSFKIDAKAASLLSDQIEDDISSGGLSPDSRLNSAEFFVALSTCKEGAFSLTVFNQDMLQERYLSSLATLSDIAIMSGAIPVLPAEKATRDLIGLKKISDEDSFDHYDVNFDGAELSIGRSYMGKY